VAAAVLTSAIKKNALYYTVQHCVMFTGSSACSCENLGPKTACECNT